MPSRGAFLWSFLRSIVRLPRALGTARSVLAVVLALVCLLSLRAYSDIGVVLDESLSTSVDRITGTGHSAVYLSHVCPETPVKLRLCRAGELGSILSTYTTLGEDQPYEWNAVPLSIYLYGVDNPEDLPLFGSPRIKRLFEEKYRDKYLTSFCTTRSCQTGNGAEWRQMVAANLSRGIYIFVAEATEEQDLKFIAEFNSLPNVNHFNGVTRNCADFTHRVINSYFPHATSPDYLNDFGMTSPKAIARSFTRYALRHPETHFRVLHFAQVPGTIKRSSEVRDGTEQLYHSKKLLVPMLLFAEHALPVVAASYLVTGRFNPERESENYPTAEITETNNQIRIAKAEKHHARATQLTALEREQRAEVGGTPEEWRLYRQDYEESVDDAVRRQIIPDREYLNFVLKYLEETATLIADDSGAVWAEVADSTGSYRIGLSASNVLASDSNSRLADMVLMARMGRVLKSPKHGRETMVELRQDWTLLQTARERDSGAAIRGPLTAQKPAASAAVSGLE